MQTSDKPLSSEQSRQNEMRLDQKIPKMKALIVRLMRQGCGRRQSKKYSKNWDQMESRRQKRIVIVKDQKGRQRVKSKPTNLIVVLSSIETTRSKNRESWG